MFRGWLNGPVAAFFVAPLLEYVGWDLADKQRKEALKRAFRWRLGKFYYSAMRELDLIVRLQSEFDLPIRYHLLADVLLRTDFWLDDNVICIYFSNPRYREGQLGRKPPAERFLGMATPRFKIHHVEVERQGFGKFWTTSDSSLEQLAKILTR